MTGAVWLRLRLDGAAAVALWRRDLTRFGRQPSRVLGALGQPIIFFWILGGGLAGTFRLPGSALAYPTYFFPGVVTMVALFASIFASVSVIEDRQRGFLQAVVAGPASAVGIAVGKTLGAASVALLQVAGFLLFAPWAGLPLADIAWGPLALALATATVTLSALGLAVAWPLTSVQGFHALQMLLMVPLWVVSGAMFPPPPAGTMAGLMAANPLALMLAAIRHALHGGEAPAAARAAASPGTAQLGGCALAVMALATACLACRRRRGGE